MLFINTRPIERAQALTQCLEHAEFTVLNLPLLALNALDYSLTLQQQFQQLEQVQAIVVVSPTAVEIGLRYLKKSGMCLAQLQHIEWIAVGKITAQALAEHGIEAHIPEVETSEGMLHLAIFSERTDLKKIAFWRGVGGRQFMMQQCLQRNIEVLNFVLYRRSCPASTVKQFDAFVVQMQQKSQPYWICVSSEASWRYWLDLCEPYIDILQQGHYLVLGERLYQILQHDKKSKNFCFNISQLNFLDEKTVLQTIQQLQRPL